MQKKKKKSHRKSWANNYKYNSHISSRNIFIGDIWLVKFPYNEAGNYYKVRPALVTGINEEKELIIVRKITSNPSKGEYIEIDTYGKREIIKKNYLTKDYISVRDYMCVSKFGRIKSNKVENKDVM